MAKGQPLKPFEYDPGPLGDEQVEIQVSHCGICHSDLSMLQDEWGQTTYPFVPGHEAVGTVAAVGSQVRKVKVGDCVGLGWMAGSCMACDQCLSGDHHLCTQGEQTIVGRYGAFADRVRCNWEWAIPVPKGLAIEKVGPLFCGGVTVFSPMLICDVKPTQRVAVVGIGGLGHLALQFLNKWGCEVWALTSSDSKRDEALRLGAHHVLNTRESAKLRGAAGTFDFIISTVNVPMDWEALLNALAPKGRLHFVGAVLQPVGIPVFTLLGGQKSVSGSPTGNPLTIVTMLDFCARHHIEPRVEQFPIQQVNEAMDHLKRGKARYRIVLKVR